MDYARETIEKYLAHVVGDKTDRAYGRSDALRKRREVLKAWSEYCLSALSESLMPLRDEGMDRMAGGGRLRVG